MLAPALLLGALSGCEGLLNDGDEQQAQHFQAAKARWQALQVNDYEFTLALACECGDPADLRDVVITVENGVPVSRVYEDDPDEAAPESIYGPYDTVEELFDIVADAISDDPDILNVGYHPTYGLPLVFQLDPNTTVGDDYLLFEVTDFSGAGS